MILSENAWDDLTKITGIGESRQEWLKGAFDIRTFRDLANLTVAQIEEKMKTDGLIVSGKAIKAWIDQAGELADRFGETLQSVEKLETELPAGVSNAMPREDGWKPIASFVVEYQTRETGERQKERRIVAHHMEEDRTKTWPGIDDEKFCKWIIEQISQEISRNQEKQKFLPTQHPKEKQDIKSTAVKITRLLIHQPANSASTIQSIDPDTHVQASVLGGQPFSFEVYFELVGPKAKEVANTRIGWKAETRILDLASDASPQLCESDPNSFEKEHLKYAHSLPKINLKQGAYRVWLLITTEQPSIVLPDYLDIPNILVV